MPEGSEQLVEDLFERITRFDNRLIAATFTRRADGTYLVRVELEARKLRGDGAGAEDEIPISDWIDIAILGERGDAGDGGTPILLERRRVSASPAVFEIVVDRRPVSVVIDPDHKLIDRDLADNVRALSPADAHRIATP